MRLRPCWMVGLMLPLVACGPKMDGSRVAGRLVVITNSDSAPFTINRIVANGSPENASCNGYPATTLNPGESYTTTFIICGPVNTLDVETDLGTTTLTAS